MRTSGSDENDGRSAIAAFATIQRAAALAGGGDAVVVGPGRYPEGNIVPRGNGRRDEPMRFFADRDGSLTGDPPGEVLVDAVGFQHGFRLSSRPWVIVNGFAVMNANDEGIAVKSTSDSTVIANCVVFSNYGRGVWVRDSADVIVFNNLIYANGGTGIDFGGDALGSPGGLAINNTVYANGLDGIRIEDNVPSPFVTVIHNVIAQNLSRGVNLKERSVEGYIEQWNLNTDGYGSEARKAVFDLPDPPLLAGPAGADRVLGDPGHVDDDFRLRQGVLGEVEQSSAVDFSPFRTRTLGLTEASTRTDGLPDAGKVDLGFHYGNKTDFVSGFRQRFEARVRALRRRAALCERLGSNALGGPTPCIAQARLLRRLRRLCGPRPEQVCQ